jgi:predicted nucleic acid-binding protein
MIVVDASVLVSLLTGALPPSAVEGEELAAPHLVDNEVAQVLRRLVRAGTYSATDGQHILDSYLTLAIRRFPSRPLLQRVWELRDNLSAYDATYVALAEGLSVPLLTADARMERAPGVRCQVRVL